MTLRLLLAALILPLLLGNTSLSGSSGAAAAGDATQFRVWGDADVTAPIITVGPIVSLETASSARVSWTTDEGGSSQLLYGLTQSYGTSFPVPATAGPNTSHQIDVTLPSDDTTYQAKVRTCDPSGNCVESANFTITTLDATAPVASGFGNAVTTSSATLTWATDEDATSWLEWGLTTGYGTTINSDATLRQSHSVLVSGLTDDTLYHWRTLSEDAAGNVVPSADQTFTTAMASTGGGGPGTLDLGDLVIAAADVGVWNPAAEAEAGYAAAQSWPEYDATCASGSCASGKTPYGNAPGDVLDGCSAAASGGGQDATALDCLLDNAPDSSVIYLPGGNYDMGTVEGQALSVRRNNVVLRCESPSTTHIRTYERGDSSTDPVTTHANNGSTGYVANRNGRAMVMAMGFPAEGSAVSWTSGFTHGTTTIGVSSTSGFTVGRYVKLNVPDSRTACSTYIPELGNDTLNAGHYLSGIYKIEAINAGQLVLDRGLKIDLTLEPGCSNNAEARPMDMVTGIGIEQCHLLSDASQSQTNMRDFPFVGLGFGTAESWVVGNIIERGEARMIDLVGSARNWIRGNTFNNFGLIGAMFNTSGVGPRRAASDNVIEDNEFNDFVTGSYMSQGAQGNVVAYNYMRHGSPPNIPERSMMNHGHYTRENLMEGNDVDGEMILADHYWGPAGQRNTAFLNRMVGGVGDRLHGISTNREKDAGPWDMGDRVNIIGNTSPYFYNSVVPCGGGGGCPNFPDQMSGANDIDGHTGEGSYTIPAFVTNMHLEKNIWRDTGTGNQDSGRVGARGFRMNTPRPDTNCGSGSGPGDCAQSPSGAHGSNVGGLAAPAGWATDTIPASMYRHGDPPTWWCRNNGTGGNPEACLWYDVHGKIGAWGDDFGGTTCKLPAQIRSEGGTCNACGPGGAGC